MEGNTVNHTVKLDRKNTDEERLARFLAQLVREQVRNRSARCL